MPSHRVPTSRHITRLAVGSHIDRSVVRDTTLHIVFGLFIIGVGNAAGGFLAGTMSIAGLVLYLLMAVPAFTYGMSYVIIGAGMVVKTATERALKAAELTVEVNDGDDSGGGRDSGGDRGDDVESPARN